MTFLIECLPELEGCLTNIVRKNCQLNLQENYAYVRDILMDVLNFPSIYDIFLKTCNKSFIKFIECAKQYRQCQYMVHEASRKKDTFEKTKIIERNCFKKNWKKIRFNFIHWNGFEPIDILWLREARMSFLENVNAIGGPIRVEIIWSQTKGINWCT